MAGSFLFSWCSCPGLKVALRGGSAGWPRRTSVWEGQEGSWWLTRLLPFSGLCLGCCQSLQPMVEACDEIPQSGPWEIAATGSGDDAKGFCRACSCAVLCTKRVMFTRRGTDSIFPFVFCSPSEAQYFDLLFVKIYNSVSSCLSASAPGALGSEFVPRDIRGFLSSFSHCQSES